MFERIEKITRNDSLSYEDIIQKIRQEDLSQYSQANFPGEVISDECLSLPDWAQSLTQFFNFAYQYERKNGVLLWIAQGIFHPVFSEQGARLILKAFLKELKTIMGGEFIGQVTLKKVYQENYEYYYFVLLLSDRPMNSCINLPKAFFSRANPKMVGFNAFNCGERFETRFVHLLQEVQFRFLPESLQIEARNLSYRMKKKYQHYRLSIQQFEGYRYFVEETQKEWRESGLNSEQDFLHAIELLEKEKQALLSPPEKPSEPNYALDIVTDVLMPHFSVLMTEMSKVDQEIKRLEQELSQFKKAANYHAYKAQLTLKDQLEKAYEEKVGFEDKKRVFKNGGYPIELKEEVATFKAEREANYQAELKSYQNELNEGERDAMVAEIQNQIDKLRADLAFFQVTDKRKRSG